MNKDELIKLAQELNGLEDLSTRRGELEFLKKEYRKIQDDEYETYADKLKSEKFIEEFEKLSIRESSLTASSYEEKKALLEKAKELLTKENVKASAKEFNQIFDSFKHSGKCSKEQDDELWSQMKEIKDQMNRKVDEHYKNVKDEFASRKEKKEAIIEQAKKILEKTNIKEMQGNFDSLLEEWKKVGFAGKDCDDDLWKQFSEQRKVFNEKRKQHFEDMKKVFEDRINKKEEIIKDVKKLTADAYFTDDEIKQIKGFRKQFIDIGFAGKDKDDDLWDRFNKAVQAYFDDMKFYK